MIVLNLIFFSFYVGLWTACFVGVRWEHDGTVGSKDLMSGTQSRPFLWLCATTEVEGVGRESYPMSSAFPAITEGLSSYENDLWQGLSKLLAVCVVCVSAMDRTDPVHLCSLDYQNFGHSHCVDDCCELWKPLRCETGFSVVIFLAACTYGLGSFLRLLQITFCVVSSRNDPPVAGLIALTSSARSLFAGFSQRMSSFSLDRPDGICGKQIAQRQVSFRSTAAFSRHMSFHQCSKLIRRQAPTQQTY